MFSSLQAASPITSLPIGQTNNDNPESGSESESEEERNVRKAARSDDEAEPEVAGGSDTEVTVNAQDQSSEANGQDEESSHIETASQVTEVEQPVSIRNGPYIKRKVVVSEEEDSDGPPGMLKGKPRLRHLTPLNELQSSPTLAGSSPLEDTPVPRNQARKETGVAEANATRKLRSHTTGGMGAKNNDPAGTNKKRDAKGKG